MIELFYKILLSEEDYNKVNIFVVVSEKKSNLLKKSQNIFSSV